MTFRRLMRMLRRWLLLAVIAALVVCTGLFAYRLTGGGLGYHRDTESLAGADLGINVKPDTGVTNIALFGVDAENEDTRRSDCIMVLTVDNQRGKIKITSLMRDSRVEIEGHGKTKLNHAYSYGGPALAIRTINDNFNLDIEHFAQVDFAQMANLIGAVGGVQIDVQEKEIKELNKFIGEYCRAVGVAECPVEEAGPQMLNGIQAMSYGRIRKGGTGDDWGRVERQSIVLEAMFARVKSMSTGEMLGLAPTALKYVTTDLSLTEIAGLVLGAFRNGTPEIEHGRIPADGTWHYGGSQNAYIEFDLEEAAVMLDRFLYEDVSLSRTGDDAVAAT